MTDAPRRTPLEAWIKTKIGLALGEPLTPEALAAYQAARLRGVFQYVLANSPFYRERLAGLPDGFPGRLEDLAQAPFTTDADLRQRPLDLLCVSQGLASRVVTVPSPDPDVSPKRLFFTDDDLEMTADFFHHGMTTLTGPGSRVMIFMPGRTPGGIGDLLQKALSRLGAGGIVHGPVTDPALAVDHLIEARADCLVGFPAQMLGLCRHPHGQKIPAGQIKSVLLSADFVPRAIVRELEEVWGGRGLRTLRPGGNGPGRRRGV